MKYFKSYCYTILLILGILTINACSGKSTKASNTEVNTMDSVSNDLEETSKKLEEQTKNLEESLEKLDKETKKTN